MEMTRRYSAFLLAGAVAFAAPGCKKATNTAETGAATGTTTAAASISELQLGRRLSADKRVAESTTKFSPRDTIYAVAVTQGSSPSTTVTARWTYEDGGQVVKEDSRTIAPNGTEATEFHISKPSGWPKGKYRVTLTMNGSTESKDFEVR
jgi:hypothetical protein